MTLSVIKTVIDSKIRSSMLKILNVKDLRWLDIVFHGQYLPTLSINCVAINKDLEKLTPQLY